MRYASPPAVAWTSIASGNNNNNNNNNNLRRWRGRVSPLARTSRTRARGRAASAQIFAEIFAELFAEIFAEMSAHQDDMIRLLSKHYSPSLREVQRQAVHECGIRSGPLGPSGPKIAEAVTDVCAVVGRDEGQRGGGGVPESDRPARNHSVISVSSGDVIRASSARHQLVISTSSSRHRRAITCHRRLSRSASPRAATPRQLQPQNARAAPPHKMQPSRCCCCCW